MRDVSLILRLFLQRRFLRGLCVLCLGIGLGVSVTAVRAQESASVAELAKKFKDGADAYAAKDYVTTISLYGDILKATQPGPMLDPVYYMIGAAHYGAGHYEDAEQGLALYLKLYPQGARVADARVGLIRSWLHQGKLNEARDLIVNSDGWDDDIDDFRMGRGLELDVVDELIKAERYDDALTVLQGVRPREDLLAAQRVRGMELKRQLDWASLQAGALGASTALGSQRELLVGRLSSAQASLLAIQADGAFDLPLCLRFGRIYLEKQKPWLALVAYREAYEQFPQAESRSYALNGMILAWQGIGRFPRALELCQQYLNDYPTGAQLAEVAFVAGQLSMQLNKPADAVGYFGQVLRPNISPKLREQIAFLLPNAKFGARDWAGARAGYRDYLTNYPAGEFRGQANYYAAMTYFLTGDFVEAMGQIRQFTENFPQSPLLPDAYYRLAVCAYSGKDYASVVERTQSWQERFGKNALLVEVLSLEGDGLKMLDREPEAIDIYLRAMRLAKGDAARVYPLREAVRLLEKAREWNRLAEIYKGLMQTYPNSPQVLDWAYGMARVRLRQHQRPEAVTVLTSHLRPFLVDPTRDLVEKALGLLAQQQARHRSAPPPVTVADTPLVSLPTVTPVQPPTSPADMLIGQLGFMAGKVPEGLVAARIEFYRYQVAYYGGQRTDAQAIMLGIGKSNGPAGLSAPIMGLAGEALGKAGDGARAEVFFKALLKNYPDSPWRDIAYVGQGDLALAAGHADVALANYTDAVDKAGGEFRLREALMGQARAQLQLGKLDEAAKLFTRVAGERAWRGEATAECLYQLGVVAAKQGDFARAINFYQRVYVGYARYPEWTARSYLESAQLFVQLGKIQEAANTYREIIKADRLKDRPEVAVARESLSKLIVQ